MIHTLALVETFRGSSPQIKMLHQLGNRTEKIIHRWYTVHIEQDIHSITQRAGRRRLRVQAPREACYCTFASS